MVRPLSKILTASLCMAVLGGLFLSPSVSAASDLGGKFMVKATNAQESEFWGIRGWNAPGRGGSNPGEGTATPPDSGSGSTPGGSTPGDGAGGSNPGGDSGSGGGQSGDPSDAPVPGLTTYSAPSGTWVDMTYGAGRYTAVGGYGDNRSAVSTDEGLTWKTYDMPAESWKAVAYGAGLYVAVGGGGSIATSADSENWESKTYGAGDYHFSSVSYGNGVFVAVGDDSTNGAILRSSDGRNWTKVALPSGFDAGDPRVQPLGNLNFEHGQFYAQSAGVGMDDVRQDSRSSVLIRSADGFNWTLSDAPAGTEFGWASNSSGSRFFSRDRVIATDSGLIQGVVPQGESNYSFLASVNGGQSWTEIPKNGIPNDGSVLFSNGGKIFAAAGNADAPYDYADLYTSSDEGKSWKMIENSKFMASPLNNFMPNARHGNCTVLLPAYGDSAIRTCS